MSKLSNSLLIIATIVGLVACDRHDTETPRSGLYRCGDDSVLTVLADFDKKDPTLSIIGVPVDLKRVKTKSGARYIETNAYGHTTTFEAVGDKPTLIIDRGDPELNYYGECTYVVANPTQDLQNFKALGHEPEWTLVFDTDKLSFDMLGRSRSVHLGAGDFKLPAMDTDQNVTMNLTQDLSVKISQRICQDNMSGQFHMYTVQVKYKGKTHNGCGFGRADPRQALLGI